MKKRLLFTIIVILSVLVACNDKEPVEETEELPVLEVDFSVPETADPGDTVELLAAVTYGGEVVTDADEVLFEIWPQGHEDDSEKIDGVNHEDGTYSINYTFEDAGIYEMYAHTTAHTMHTMPKKQINVGDVEEAKTEEHEHGGDHEHSGFHTEGFDLHFEVPEEVNINEEITLMTHLSLHDKLLENANVRYEIWQENADPEWVDATEEPKGEYTGVYTFPVTGTYHIQIHVKDDADLHEHMTYDIEVGD